MYIRDRRKANRCGQQYHCGQTTVACKQLEGHHPRQMGVAGHSGVRNRVCSNTTTSQPPNASSLLRAGVAPHEAVCDRAHIKRGNRGGDLPRSVSIHPVSGSKEGLKGRKLLEAPQIQARDLSRLIGKMSAAMRAIPPAPLFYRTLQAELAQALAHHDQDYNAPLVLTREAKEELQWWNDHLLQWNGKALISPKPTVTITTDASLTGWGQEIRTGGPWSFLEAQEHINWLELQAAFLGIKSFLRDRRSVSVLLQLDKVRSNRSRPLCLQADGTPTKVLQLATGSPGRGDRCISPRLEPYPGVCQPTMVPARPSPGSCAHPTGTSHTDSPSMEDPALVPGPPQHVSLHAPADSEAATGGVPGGTQAKPCGGKATASS